MDQSEKKLAKRIGKGFFWLLAGAGVVGLCALFLLLIAGVSFFSISGDSMSPTLKSGDAVVLNQSKEIKRDELIFFSKPNGWDYLTEKFKDDGKVVVKRITAIPGDTISFDGQSFQVNGKEVFNNTSYPCADGPKDFSEELEENEFFVMGDNAGVSLDSRRVFCDGREDFLILKKNVVDYGTVRFKF